MANMEENGCPLIATAAFISSRKTTAPSRTLIMWHARRSPSDGARRSPVDMDQWQHPQGLRQDRTVLSSRWMGRPMTQSWRASGDSGFEIVRRDDFSDTTYLLEFRHPLMARA